MCGYTALLSSQKVLLEGATIAFPNILCSPSKSLKKKSQRVFLYHITILNWFKLRNMKSWANHAFTLRSLFLPSPPPGLGAVTLLPPLQEGYGPRVHSSRNIVRAFKSCAISSLYSRVLKHIYSIPTPPKIIYQSGHH